MRWVLLDEVLTIRKGAEARSRSRVPEKGAGQELLMMEMMAQTGGLLAGAEKDFQEDLILAKIEESVFFPGYEPGQRIEIRARSESLRPEGAWIQARIESSEGPVARSRFLLMSLGKLSDQGPAAFHSHFMNHFQIREKVCG